MAAQINMIEQMKRLVYPLAGIWEALTDVGGQRGETTFRNVDSGSVGIEAFQEVLSFAIGNILGRFEFVASNLKMIDKLDEMDKSTVEYQANKDLVDGLSKQKLPTGETAKSYEDVRTLILHRVGQAAQVLLGLPEGVKQYAILMLLLAEGGVKITDIIPEEFAIKLRGVSEQLKDEIENDPSIKSVEDLRNNEDVREKIINAINKEFGGPGIRTPESDQQHAKKVLKQAREAIKGIKDI